MIHRTAVALVWLAIVQAAPAQTWAPNEMQVSTEQQLIDPEFSQRRLQLVWSDVAGRVWVAGVDRASGAIVPPDGRGQLVDVDGATGEDSTYTFNGPEWVRGLAGDDIVYTKYPTGVAHTQRSARIGIARDDGAGGWATQFLSPDRSRMAPYGSEDLDDPTPQITTVDNVGRHYVRGTGSANTEVALPMVPNSNVPVRFVRGAAAALVVLDDGTGVQQAHYLDFDTLAFTKLTADAGSKQIAWMWRAPELGGEFQMAALVDSVELRVYRMGASGWVPAFSLFAPSGRKLSSIEPFLWRGRSFLSMTATAAPTRFPSEVWIADLDAAAPQLKRITPLEPLLTRTDPEVLILDGGVRVYYNRFAVTPDEPRPKACATVACSQGLWMSDPGL